MNGAVRASWAAGDQWAAAIRVAASLTVAYDLCVDVTGQVVPVEGVADATTTRTHAGQVDYNPHEFFPLRSLVDAAGTVGVWWECGMIRSANLDEAAIDIEYHLSSGQEESADGIWEALKREYREQLSLMNWAFQILVRHRLLFEELANCLKMGETITPPKLRGRAIATHVGS